MGNLITYTKKRIALLTILCMLFTLMPATVSAATATDISGHWAQSTIQVWTDNNLIEGYPDGTFKPDNNVTRGEFITLVNRAFNYTGTAPISFTDVNQNEWYTTAIGVAAKAGYIAGYPDGTMRPENPISREEAATIIDRIKNLVDNPGAVTVYTDASSITWSKGEVGAVTAADIMQGYPDGSFMPKGFITRAEIVIALDNAMHYTVPVVITPGIANVATLAELNTALEDNTVETINITAPIATAEEIVISRAVTINGGNNGITFTGDAAGWQGNYVLQIYNTTGVVLNNVTVTGADGGILVNGSAVELTGITTVAGNEFGGIEVSKGTASGLVNSVLTVTATLVNLDEAYGEPTIWLVKDQGTVVGANVPANTNVTLKTDQTQYYLNIANSTEV